MSQLSILNGKIQITREQEVHDLPNLFIANLDNETQTKWFVFHVKISPEIHVNIFSICDSDGKIMCAHSYCGEAEVEIKTELADFLRENFDFLYDYSINFSEESPQDEFLSLGSDLLYTVIESEGQIPQRVIRKSERTTKRSG